jgi:hypothetical protein
MGIAFRPRMNANGRECERERDPAFFSCSIPIPLRSFAANSVFGILAAASLSTVAAAPARVQFSRQVLPVLSRECAGCHTGAAAPGGFSMENPDRLLAGGRHGRAVVPGKSADSTLVKYVLGQLKPQMPPGKPLALDTIALLRRWIDEGGKVDSMTPPPVWGGGVADAMPLKSGMPKPMAQPGAAHGPLALLPLPVSQAAPVTALAYSPDGQLLAVGGYHAVRLLSPTGAVVTALPGPVDQVLSLAWSSDGKHLAAAGGVPGASGELCLWDAPVSGSAWGKPRVLKEHADSIYSVAWRPGTMELATASPDKTVKLWDAATGKVTRTLKDHADAVFAVAYSPDGKWMATASADRSVKLYQAGTQNRALSLPHGDAVTAVAFSAKSDLLATACVDKQVRVWPVKAEVAQNPLRSHGEGEPVNALAFSAGGDAFAWGAANRKVRLWNGDVSSQRREMNDAADWIYSVAVSPDGKTVVGGGGDGKAYFWDAEGKLLRAMTLGGNGLVAATAEGKQ